LAWLGLIGLPRSSKIRPARIDGDRDRVSFRATARSASFAWMAEEVVIKDRHVFAPVDFAPIDDLPNVLISSLICLHSRGIFE